MGKAGSGPACIVCHEKGGDMRYVPGTKQGVHHTCRDKCLKCKQPKDLDGFYCDDCKAEARQSGKEIELPFFTTDLSERAHRAAKSPITGKSYPVRVHQRDDD